MAKNERIQIPITAEKKKKLEAKAEQQGFDTTTDAVRFLINSFLNDRINITLGTSVELASEELERAIAESMADFKAGRSITLDPDDPDFHNKLIEFADKSD